MVVELVEKKLVTAQLNSTCHFSRFYQSAFFFCGTSSFFLSFFFFSPPIFCVSGLAIPVSRSPRDLYVFFFFFSHSIFRVSGHAISVSRFPFFSVLRFSVYLALPSLCLGPPGIRTRCLLGGFWPKCYSFQSALVAFLGGFWPKCFGFQSH